MEERKRAMRLLMGLSKPPTTRHWLVYFFFFFFWWQTRTNWTGFFLLLFSPFLLLLSTVTTTSSRTRVVIISPHPLTLLYRLISFGIFSFFLYPPTPRRLRDYRIHILGRVESNAFSHLEEDDGISLLSHRKNSTEREISPRSTQRSSVQQQYENDYT